MSSDEVFSFVDNRIIISEEGKKLSINKVYLSYFGYFQKIFQDTPDIKEIKVEEPFEDLKSFFSCIYNRKHNSSKDVYSISRLLKKWEWDEEYDFCYFNMTCIEELQDICPSSEEFFRDKIESLLESRKNRTMLKEIKLSDSMKLFLFDILTQDYL
jgi:hypothetical protein